MDHTVFRFTEDYQLRTEDGLIRPRKLGLLAGTFEDGSFSVFSVPYPRDLPSPNTQGPINGEEWDSLLSLILHTQNHKSSKCRAYTPHRTARYRLLDF